MSTEETFLGFNEQTEWIERQAIPELGFRVWHVMFFCLSGLLAIGNIIYFFIIIT